jgi:nitroimidazol reductase NimA-like FMN-containing flavoprotein (pyridoxamine 5'-phosphate oxidase superfamily)
MALCFELFFDYYESTIFKELIVSKDYASLPLNQVRRADRAVSDEAWIKEYLHRTPFGVMATALDGQPFVNSNLFVYDETNHAIYLHTARVGRTQANAQANPRVCFSISDMGRLLPADVALEFSVEYSGVTVFGTVTIVTDKAEAEHGLQLLLDKYFPHLTPGEHYRPITPDEIKQTAVYRIDIEQWSGKRKQVEADFPGAFLYGQSS